MIKNPLRIPVEDISHAGEARRAANGYCRSMSFSEADIGRAALIVTEMATNLARHSSGGELMIQSIECGGTMGLEVLSIDRGPGMANPFQSLEDGFSTAGGSGTGLGAIMRASSQFDIFSEPQKGTVVMSRCWTGQDHKDLSASPVEVSGICLPMNDREPCGDGWAVEQTGRRTLVLVSDGLGHGPAAAEASREAARVFRSNRARAPREIAEALHAGLRGTRGAAIVVLEVDHVDAVVRYCGIGNIAGRIITANVEKSLISHNGTVGHQASKMQEFSHPWDDSSLLILHSDGISVKWRLSDSPRLAARHPSVIAAVLYRDFKRGKDDLTLVAARKSRLESSQQRLGRFIPGARA